MPHGWAKPISAISAISAGLKKSKKYSGTEKIKKFQRDRKIIGANKQTNEQYTQFVSCFMFHVSLSTFHMWIMEVILIYNIYIIY